MAEKAVQETAEPLREDEKMTNERVVDVEAVSTMHDHNDALQHLERLRKQYGVSHDDPSPRNSRRNSTQH
jgi:hypothetical protein